MYQCVKCCKVLEKLLMKISQGSILVRGFDVFESFKRFVRFNSRKRFENIDMSRCFYTKYNYVKGSEISKVFSHLVNGELFHDCYYDINDSNDKLFFFNSFKCFKLYGNKRVLTAPRYSNGNEIDFFFLINLLQGDRNSEYFQFVKEAFDCYIIF